MVRFPIPLPEVHAWKGWTPKTEPAQAIIKRDWVPTGRIDFATRVNGKPGEADQPSDFKLIVEERRIVESVTGLENLEIRWRQATLREAKIVVVQYHKYLVDNALIKYVVDESALVPPIPATKKIAKPAEISAKPADVAAEERPAA
jgi:hypothetical protein